MILSTGDAPFPATHAYLREANYSWYTLELIVSGSMQRRSGTRAQFIDQAVNALILTPPGTPYALRAQRPGREIWAIFQPRRGLLDNCLDWPLGPHGIPQLALASGSVTAEIISTFADVHTYFCSSLPAHRQLAENALERVLLLAWSHHARAALVPLDKRVQATIDLMQADFRAAHSVESLAKRVNLSPSRFAHLFRGETGVSPMQYMETLRLEQARQLLVRSTEPIKQIAWQVGYEDANHFATRFRHYYQQSPSAWRRGVVERR